MSKTADTKMCKTDFCLLSFVGIRLESHTSREEQVAEESLSASDKRKLTGSGDSCVVTNLMCSALRTAI